MPANPGNHVGPRSREAVSRGLRCGPLRQGEGGITSASVTTPFLKRRSSSSSDEHLGVVKEEMHLAGNPPDS